MAKGISPNYKMFLFNLSDIYQTAANEVGSGSSFPSFKMYFSKLQIVTHAKSCFLGDVSGAKQCAGQQAPPKYLTESSPAGSVWCGARSAASVFQILNDFPSSILNVFVQTANRVLDALASLDFTLVSK